jgi:hypothetical protein
LYISLKETKKETILQYIHSSLWNKKFARNIDDWIAELEGLRIIFCSIVNIHLTMVIYTNIIPAFNDLLRQSIIYNIISSSYTVSICVWKPSFRTCILKWNSDFLYFSGVNNDTLYRPCCLTLCCFCGCSCLNSYALFYLLHKLNFWTFILVWHNPTKGNRPRLSTSTQCVL